MQHLPQFLIAGTQKGGTTWLEHQLAHHPDVFTPRRQLHFFDRHFDRGVEWYAAQFRGHSPRQVLGEKTTEYFDTLGGALISERIAATIPDVKLIIILRDPVDRAISALRHMVNSGLEPLPEDFEGTLYADMDRPEGEGWRYIERGFYAQQLDAVYANFPKEQVLVLILEEDIKRNPARCWSKVCSFLGVAEIAPARDLDKSVNVLRLSPIAIRASALLYRVPFARGVIRRLDRLLRLRPWAPKVSDGARQRLANLYHPKNQTLETLLGRKLSAWTGME